MVLSQVLRVLWLKKQITFYCFVHLSRILCCSQDESLQATNKREEVTVKTNQLHQTASLSHESADRAPAQRSEASQVQRRADFLYLVSWDIRVTQICQ